MTDTVASAQPPLIRILDNYRKSQGDISDREVQRRAELADGSLAKVRKSGKADVNTLQRLAKAIGCTVGQLLGESAGDPNAPEDITMIAVDLIDDINNPRQRNIKQEAIEQLAASIFDQGLFNPLLVRPIGDRFELIAGRRRRLAILHLIATKQWATGSRVPCRVANVKDRQARIMALTENLQREDLDDVDEAEAFKAMQDEGMDTKEIATAVRKDLRYVQMRIALIKKLPAADKAALKAGTMTITEAREKVTKPRASHEAKKTNAVRRPPEPTGPIKPGRAYNPHPKAIKADYQFHSLVSRGTDGPMPIELTLWDPYQANEAKYVRHDQHYATRFQIRDVTWKGADSPATITVFDPVENRTRSYVRADLVDSSQLDHGRPDEAADVPTKTQAAALGVKPELQRKDLRAEHDTEDMPADQIPAFLRRKKDGAA